MTTTADTTIEVLNLVKSYGDVVALEVEELTVPAGQSVVLVGWTLVVAATLVLMAVGFGTVLVFNLGRTSESLRWQDEQAGRAAAAADKYRKALALDVDAPGAKAALGRLGAAQSAGMPEKKSAWPRAFVTRSATG